MKMKSIISKILICTITASTLFTSSPKTAYADSYKVVTLGNDLNEDQKSEMLEYFGVNKDDAQVLTITSKEEYDALSKIATSSQIGSRSISCSYVDTSYSDGLIIQTKNLTWVTDGMIRNALITAGVTKAKVIAASPFKVSGTAALTGILKGFEKSDNGSELSEEKKEAANEELMVTGKLSDKIGQDDATNLMNEIKTEIIKDKPDSQNELEKTVKDVINDYKYDLSNTDIEQINNVMAKINSLDINYNDIKNYLSDITDSLKDKIDSDAVKGFFSKIADFFKGIWDSIVNFFN